MHAFQPGIGLMTVRLKVPVVPIFLDGLYEVYSIHDSWPKPGPVSVSIGRSLEFPPDTDYADAARRIEDAIHVLSWSSPITKIFAKRSDTDAQNT